MRGSTGDTALDPSAGAPRAAALAQLEARVRACRLCEEHGYLQHARPLYHAVPDADIMLIGQAPGRLSSQRGRNFASPGGQALRAWLARIGLDDAAFDGRIQLSALTRCFPGPSPSGTGDRRPSPQECALCRPYLDAELAILQPRLVLLVGKMAIDAFMPGAARRRMDELVGSVHQDGERLYVPLPHPSGVSRWLNAPANQALLEQALRHVQTWMQRETRA
jgi:uracil-DNA glycosylase